MERTSIPNRLSLSDIVLLKACVLGGYDTDKMVLVSEKCSYAYDTYFLNLKTKDVGKNVKLWKSANWDEETIKGCISDTIRRACDD